MTDDDDLEGWLAAALQQKQMERALSYDRAGRHFGNLPDDTLTQDWVAAFRHYAANPADDLVNDLQEALESEMRLRGREPPWSAVAPEIETLKGLVRHRRISCVARR